MEKVYISIKNSGIVNLVAGVTTLMVSISMIISGVRLLQNRSKLLF